ncbi:MAG: hypothetical protein FWE70_03745 [Oscillospiraceae bacterium]|nr:hypothetical protein [Oscillospiraceae bacterium]
MTTISRTERHKGRGAAVRAMAYALSALLTFMALASCGADDEADLLYGISSEGSSASTDDLGGGRIGEVGKNEASSFNFAIPSGYTNQANRNNLNKLVERYYGERGVTVNVVYDEDNATVFRWGGGAQGREGFLAENAIDLFYVNQPEADGEPQTLSLPVEGILRQHAPSFFMRLNDYELDYARDRSGTVMAIPKHFPYSNKLCVIVKAEYLDKYGVAEINTIQDYERFMRLVKDAEPDIYPGNQTSINLRAICQSQGYVTPHFPIAHRIDLPNSTPVIWPLTDDFKVALAMVDSWTKDGLVRDLDLFFEFLTNGTVSIVTSIDGVSRMLRETLGLIDVKVFPLNKEQPAYHTTPNIFLAIHKDSAKGKEVAEFIEWVFSSQSTYDLLMYGESGVDYEVVNGKVHYTPGIQPIYIQTYQTAFLNIDLMRLLSYEDDNFKEFYTSNLYEFRPDYSDPELEGINFGEYSEMRGNLRNSMAAIESQIIADKSVNYEDIERRLLSFADDRNEEMLGAYGILYRQMK